MVDNRLPMDSFVVEYFLVNGNSFDDYFTLRGPRFITKSPDILKRLEIEGCIQNMSIPTPNFKSKRASEEQMKRGFKLMRGCIVASDN